MIAVGSPHRVAVGRESGGAKPSILGDENAPRGREKSGRKQSAVYWVPGRSRRAHNRRGTSCSPGSERFGHVELNAP